MTISFPRACITSIFASCWLGTVPHGAGGASSISGRSTRSSPWESRVIKATLVVLFFMHVKYSTRLTWAVVARQRVLAGDPARPDLQRLPHARVADIQDTREDPKSEVSSLRSDQTSGLGLRFSVGSRRRKPACWRRGRRANRADGPPPRWVW